MEGSQRPTKRDFAHFLSIALSSAAEASYLLELCADLGYVPAAAAAPIIQEYSEVIKMLSALRLRILKSQ